MSKTYTEPEVNPPLCMPPCTFLTVAWARVGSSWIWTRRTFQYLSHLLLFLYSVVPSAVQFTLLLNPLYFGSFPPRSLCVSVIGHLNEKASNCRIRGECLSLSPSFCLSKCEWERERETVSYSRQSPRDVLKNKSIWRRSLWLQLGSLCVFVLYCLCNVYCIYHLVKYPEWKPPCFKIHSERLF